jgi:predicted negative regulator of RcsB-dependent stress response
MAEYETEEQQVEALKDWWKQNGIAVIGGAVLGISALVGWHGWNWHQENQAIEASDVYTVVQETLAKGDETALAEQVNILQDQYGSTPYASLAVLHHAKVQVDKDNGAAAEESLRWVIKNSKQETVQNVAQLRLARLLLADNKIDEAQSMVSAGMSEAYTSLAKEIQGDIFVAKGDIEEAKKAYDEAMLTGSGSGIEYLQLKRSDLGS